MAGIRGESPLEQALLTVEYGFGWPARPLKATKKPHYGHLQHSHVEEGAI